MCEKKDGFYMKKRAIWIIVILFLLSGIVYVGSTIYPDQVNPESLFEPQEPEEEDVVPQAGREEEKREEEPPPPEELCRWRSTGLMKKDEPISFSDSHGCAQTLSEVMRAFRTDTIISISIDFENPGSLQWYQFQTQLS